MTGPAVSANLIAFLSAVIGALIGALIPWMYGRKQAWDTAREIILTHLRDVHEATIHMVQNPCYENHYAFQFLMKNESTYLIHQSKAFFCKRRLLVRLSKEILENYVLMDLEPDNEEVLLTQTADTMKKGHLLFCVQQMVSQIGEQLVQGNRAKES
jgi:hypothetical protein